MLDRGQTVVSNNLIKWQEVIRSWYPDTEYQDINRNYSSYQVTWKKRNKPVIAATFCPDKHKRMIQTGQQNEQNLIDWLKKVNCLQTSLPFPAPKAVLAGSTKSATVIAGLIKSNMVVVGLAKFDTDDTAIIFILKSNTAVAESIKSDTRF